MTSTRFTIAEAAGRMAAAARSDLESLPPAERRKVEAVLASNRDCKGRSRRELLTPTGAGRYR